MRVRKVRACAVLAAAGGLMAASSGLASAQQPTVSTYKQAAFKAQNVKIQRLTAASQMTKDEQAPARAFTGPTSMQVDPENPRVIVAATANLRAKICHLAFSTDAGRTWHLSKELPGSSTYPYCTNATAGVPHVMVAWGRNGTLYYARQAYGEGEGPREGKSSILLARTTDLGEHWQTTMVEDNRSATGPTPASATGVHGLTVDTSGPRDIVSVGYTHSFPDAPTGSPLRNPHVLVATSTDGGVTFGQPVDLNDSQRPTITIAGKSYQLFMRSGFGAPFLFAHDGVLLAVAGPDLPANDQPTPPPEAGAGLTPGSWYAYPMPQLIARSTDHGKTWTITTLGPPIYAGTGSFTGLGWTPKGGAKGTYVATYAATPETSPTTGVADVVVQRSTDDGVTWSEPLAIDDDNPDQHATSFYPNLSVAPNGRIDVSWQDNRDTADYFFHVRYTYSNDGGATWQPNVQVSDRPINFNFGVSFNSDIRQPSGIASTNQYAVFGWADTRLADSVTQTQDNFSSIAQFSPLPTTSNTVAPKIAAVCAGLVGAGIVLLAILALRRRREGPEPSVVKGREPVGVR
jgi:hypothetical protein